MQKMGKVQRPESFGSGDVWRPESFGFRGFMAGLSWIAVAFFGSFSGILLAAEPLDLNVHLREGMILDGTGEPAESGDVGIRDGKIVAVGKFDVARADVVLDCKGMVIAPGFIDLHNHSDRQVVNRLTRGNVNFLTQGCTTVVTGNCGSGPVDAKEYYDQIDLAGAGTHVAHLLPQGSLRDQVLGTEERAATADELEQMRQLTRAAMEAGVWGMSTGLIYVPSSYADTAEIVEIAKIVGEYGGLYASHIRGEGVAVLASVQEALDIGEAAGTPVHISHFKSSGPDAWGLVRQAAILIETARKTGRKVTADQYPYIASSTSLEAMLIPTWARAGGGNAFRARLDDPEQGKRIREFIQAELDKREGRAPIRLARYAPQQKWVGLSLEEIGKLENRQLLDIVLEISRNGGAAAVSFGMNEDDVRHIMQIPWVATASDGRAYLTGSDRPHPRNYGTFPRKIGYYALAEKVLPLEQAIRSASGLPADILGMTDRGYLKPGLVADIVVFDPATLRDTATFADPHQYAVGVREVFVAGVPAVSRGVPTGALAGKALRRQLPSKPAEKSPEKTPEKDRQ